MLKVAVVCGGSRGLSVGIDSILNAIGILYRVVCWY
jgi:hypothetical protein